MRIARLLSTTLAIAIGAALACAPRPSGDASPSPSTSASPGPRSSRGHSLPPPSSFYAALDHGFDRAVANAECEGCHADVAAEWRASLHRESYRDPSFLASFALEPVSFCRNCHAPELDPKVPLLTAGRPTTLEGFAADDGIACVTCHLPSAGATGVTTAAMPAGHRPVVPEARTDEVACGGCHQFPFADGIARTRTEWMQATMIEHARSASPDVSCRTCHMPRVDGHASHRFAASRDEAMIRRAARVTVERAGDVVTVTLSSGDAGHAFPTGDLLRRLSITAFAGDPAHPQVRRTVFLARHFEDEQELPGIVVRVVRIDDRLGFLGPESRVVRLTLAGAGTLPVHFRVAYQRVQHLGAGELDAEVAGEIVLSQGDLP